MPTKKLLFLLFLLAGCFKSDPGSRKTFNPFAEVKGLEGVRKLNTSEMTWLKHICESLVVKNTTFRQDAGSFLNKSHYFKHSQLECGIVVERDNEDKLLLRLAGDELVFERQDTNLNIFEDVVVHDRGVLKGFCELRFRHLGDAPPIENRYPLDDQKHVSLIEIAGHGLDAYEVNLSHWELKEKQYIKLSDEILYLSKNARPIAGFVTRRIRISKCARANDKLDQLEARYMHSDP